MGVSAAIACIVGSYRHLRYLEDTGVLSEKTRQLYHNLLNALVLECSILVVAMVTPYVIIQKLAAARYRPILTMLVWRYIFLFPIFNMCFTTLYITTYRKVLIRFYRKIRSEKKAGVVLIVESTT